MMKSLLDWAVRRAGNRAARLAELGVLPADAPPAASPPSEAARVEQLQDLVERITQLSAAGQHAQALTWAQQCFEAYPSRDASLLLAGQLRACGQPARAAALLQPLVLHAPDDGALLQAWARCEADSRRDSPEAMPSSPGAPAAAQYLSRGNRALADGDLDAAASLYLQACGADPANAAARLNRAFVALEQRQLELAAAQLSLCQMLLHLWPDEALQIDAHFLQGKVWALSGDTERALASLQQAADAQRGFAEPLEEGVALLTRINRHTEAISWAERLLAVRAGTESELALAGALVGACRFSQALDLLDGVLTREPDNATAWAGRGDALQGLDRGQEALACFDRALELVGPTPVAQRNRAVALRHLGQLAEARALLEALNQADPHDTETLYNLVLVLQSQGDAAASFTYLDAALARHPQDGRFHWAHAFIRLLAGDFARGWPAHEWRWHPTVAATERPRHGCSAWAGEDLTGKTLLLFAEQGLGDSIQFLRFVPQAARRAGRVLLLLPPALHGLALASGLPANCSVVGTHDRHVRVDVDLPLMSLPLVLGITAESDLGMEQPYVTPDPARARAWSARLQALGPGLRVGLVWSGNAAHRNDHHRSIPLAILRKLDAQGCHFISLQPQVRDGDQAALAQWPSLHRWGLELKGFEETAALVAELDLVVSVDTSVCHLAGALGIPTWILLPYAPDWRWMLHRSDSPWYPSVTLYRQPAPRAWEPVLARVRADLEALARR